MSARLMDGGVRLEQRRIARFVPSGGQLDRIEFVDGNPLPCDALFAHPRQRQGDLVRSLGLALDGDYVQVDGVQRETSIPGIYAGGDLSRRYKALLSRRRARHCLGVENEYVLTNMTMAGADAKKSGIETTTAYELTGENEKLACPHVGHRVEIAGILKAAEVSAAGATGGATAGTPPSGVDVVSKDLRLRELEVTTVKMLAPTCTAP